MKKGGWQTMLCFLVGAALSASAGWAGMSVATKTNVKTMEAARSGLNQALQIAFAGGAVMGFSVVAFGILGLTVLFYIFAVAQSSPAASWWVRHSTCVTLSVTLRLRFRCLLHRALRACRGWYLHQGC